MGKKSTIKVFLLDHEDSCCRTVKEIDKENSLQAMYHLLHCDLVDVREITVIDDETGKKYIYDIWFDEEFLLKSRPVATFLLGNLANRESCYPICGSWLIAKHDKEGATCGLSDKDIERIWCYTDINSIQLQIAFSRGYFNR